MTIERGTDGLPDKYTPVKKDRAAKMFHGDSAALSSWKSVTALVVFLVNTAQPDVSLDAGEALAEARRLWVAYDHPAADGAASSDYPTARHDPVMRISRHFARRSFSANVEGASSQQQWDKPGRRVLQGALSVSATNFRDDLRRLVFDPEFQERHVRRVPDSGPLRRNGHSFNTKSSWGASSYAVYGEITQARRPISFVHLEVHDAGAVAIYFREEVADGTLAELVGWWVYGAIEAALNVLQHLGAVGGAEATLLVDRHGVVEASYPHNQGEKSLRSDLTYANFSRRLAFVQLSDFTLWDHAAGDPEQWRYQATHQLTSEAELRVREALDPSGRLESWADAHNRLSGGRR